MKIWDNNPNYTLADDKKRAINRMTEIDNKINHDLFHYNPRRMYDYLIWFIENIDTFHEKFITAQNLVYIGLAESPLTNKKIDLWDYLIILGELLKKIGDPKLVFGFNVAMAKIIWELSDWYIEHIWAFTMSMGIVNKYFKEREKSYWQNPVEINVEDTKRIWLWILNN